MGYKKSKKRVKKSLYTKLPKWAKAAVKRAAGSRKKKSRRRRY